MISIKHLFIALLLFAAPCEAAVTFDAGSTSVCVDNTTNATSTTCSTITVGSGSNRVLICGISWTATPTSPTVTWDSGGTNQAMTQITSNLNTRFNALYGLVNPTSGLKTLSIAWSNGITGTQTGCASYAGASQAGGATTFYNSTTASGTGTAISVACPSIASGDMAMDNAEGDQGISTPTQTSIAIGSGGISFNEGLSRASGAGGSITFGWTLGASAIWTDICTGIKQVSSALHLLGTTGAGQ